MSNPPSLLPVKVVPNASRSEIAGWVGEALKVRVRAPAIEGRANEELCRFLSEVLDVPRRAVSVETGGASRQKRIRVEGLTLAEITVRLAAATD